MADSNTIEKKWAGVGWVGCGRWVRGLRRHAGPHCRSSSKACGGSVPLCQKVFPYKSTICRDQTIIRSSELAINGTRPHGFRAALHTALLLRFSGILLLPCSWDKTWVTVLLPRSVPGWESHTAGQESTGYLPLWKTPSNWYHAKLVILHSRYPADLVTLSSCYPAELVTLRSRAVLLFCQSVPVWLNPCRD